VSSLVNFGVGLVLGFAGVAANIGQNGANAISLPLTFIVTAVMISTMLPTTFVRGLLVALLQFVVIIVVVLAIAIVAGMIFGGFTLMNR
jgi:hypothetical protein